MEQATVNQRIAKLVEFFARGNKSAFAKSVGITSQSLGEIIGGRQSAPSFVALQKIALAYPSVSLNWLVLGEGPMTELTDENQAHKLEQYADEVESHARQLYDLGLITSEEYLPPTSDLEELRTREELARVELSEAIERERRYTQLVQDTRGNPTLKESNIKRKEPSSAKKALKLAEDEYLFAVRNRMRAERVQYGFSTDSSTAIYRLHEDGEPDSLYGGRLSTRLSISNEAAERLVKEGKIRATYIDGEGYRITEQAVRMFLGEF